MKRINCKRCLYYFVTWDANKPHGCKAFNFKSPDIPSAVVKSSSGRNCETYMEKPKRK